MIWYLINLLCILIIWKIKGPKANAGSHSLLEEETIKIKTKRTCIVGVLNWVLLSGLRKVDVGDDTLAYKIYRFERTITRTWSDVLSDIPEAFSFSPLVKDPGYTLIEKTFQFFSKNYQFWLVFIAILFIVPMGYWIYKMSKNACMSFVLFSTLFYAFFAVTGLRQTIATTLIVWGGYKFIRENKLIPFLAIAIAAFTVHRSAICFVPFFFVSKVKINKYTLSAYWIVIISAFIFRYNMLFFLQGIVGYESYNDYEGAHAGSFLIILILVAIFVTVFYKKIVNDGDEDTERFINALMISCVFSPLLLINQSTMRVIQYYSLFLMFLLPQLDVVFDGKVKHLYYMITELLMIVLLIIRSPYYSPFFL